MPPDTKSPTSSPTPRSPSPRPIAATDPKLPSPTTTPPPNPLKRTASRDVEHPSSPSPPSPQHVPASSVAVHVQQQQQQSPQQGEYETGRVICECGAAISFRDEKTGGFDLKLWDAHRLSCPASVTAPSGEPVIYTPESTAHALANPPVKRRRAKRTEDERIDYLRADPYVAQFEAYRVLCASCDKWIRLRPNSTYCSIPWDAHRKSCLAKKIKNVYALEERNALFAKDPDVRKFDAERVLCNMCDRWIALNPDDHLQAVQKWLQHRASCQKGPSQSSVNIVSSGPVDLNPTGKATSPDAHHSQLQQHPQQQQQPHHANGVSGSNPHQRTPASPSPRPSTSSTTHQAAPIHRPSSSSLIPHHSSHHQQQQPPPHPHPHGHAHAHQHQTHHSSSSFHDLNPANYTPAHESRRRNAEQRAATLRADTLIGEVEPNRVFCTLCQKWVQLRQDSSYCAYPWLQHRTKCLARQ
ncbi:hypothetical protein BDN72DRAFT_466619 [Pluteus cervinus]|uniref:Uncharacterized protein n=1 Tax=Pluteus cervinus TaxID=181527 RepID=A0ACD3A6S3_9AGAR|nr:hypothetical protein BDN72DRAFT_466619 [Pluteus cervinus]